jgi:hypothetical protein
MGNLFVIMENKSVQTDGKNEEKEIQTIDGDFLELSCRSSSGSYKKKSVSFTDDTDAYKHVRPIKITRNTLSPLLSPNNSSPKDFVCDKQMNNFMIEISTK